MAKTTIYPSRRRVQAGLLSCIVCVLAVLGQTNHLAAGPAAKKAAAGTWTQYRDAQYHFTLSHPVGWTVRVDAHTILVQSADHSAFSMIESFTPNEGEDAQARLADIPNAEAALLPSATVDRTSPSRTGKSSDGAVAAISYQGVNGSGTARVLCNITPQGGLLYAMAGPSASFSAKRAILLRILKSLTFGTPTASATRAIHPTGGTPFKLIPSSVQYVNWKDPNEAAFQLDVPKGWEVQGGLYHMAVSDSRMMVMAHSPAAGVTILLSDSSIPVFTEPTQMTERLGYRVGAPFTLNGNSKSMLFDYMPAKDFNHWYLQTHLSQYIDGLEITDDKDLPEMAAASAARLATGPMMPRHTVTADETAFTGRDKGTGQPISGSLSSVTTEFQMGVQYGGGGTWSAVPALYVCTADSKEAGRRAVALAVLGHMRQTMRLDPTWVRTDQEKQQEILRDMQREGAEVLQHRYEQYTEQADAKRQTMNENFLENMGGKAEGQRKELNYINGTTDVANPNTGATAKVTWGYNHYDQDEKTGVITGSNEPYGTQDLGLTPLSKF